MASRKKTKGEVAEAAATGEAPAALEGGAPAAPALPALSKHQKFTIVRMARAAVQNCPFNPRRIDAFSRKKLREFIKSLGLLEPLIFDRTSGFLVGGHQRLAALDALEGSGDYSLDFAVVELTPRQLRKALVGLNSKNMMGEWDLPILKTILEDQEVKFDFEEVGFSSVGLEDMFGGTGVALEMFSSSKAPAFVQEASAEILEAGQRGGDAPEDGADADDAETAETGEQGEMDRRAQEEYERVRDAAARKDKILREKSALQASLTSPAETTDYLIHVVCRDDKDRVARLEELGLPADVRYLDVRTLWTKGAARWGGSSGSTAGGGAAPSGSSGAT